MSWDLELDFLGLTGLIPLDAGRWLVVLPDLKQGGDPAAGLDDIKAHQALVAVRSNHVDAATSPELEPRVRRWTADGELDFYELGQHHVRLPGVGAGASLVKDGSERDISTVPSIGEVEPVAAQFDGSLLVDWWGEQIAPSAALAATVLLDRGHLGARDLLREGVNDVSTYEFKSSDQAQPVGPPRPMADGFRLTVRIDLDSASVTFGDKDGNDRQLVIDPKDATRVTVSFYNQELEDILGFPSEPVPPREGDIDFKIFYRLSKGWQSLGGGPLPVPYRVSDGGGGRNRPCRGTVYQEVGY